MLTAERPAPRAGPATQKVLLVTGYLVAGICLPSLSKRGAALNRCLPGGPGGWSLLEQKLLAYKAGWLLGLSLNGGLRSVFLELRASGH